jgi:hypothetical protein
LSATGDLSEWISTSGTKKVCKGQIWRVWQVGYDSRLMLRQKFTDEEQRVSRCVVVVLHPGLVSPPLRPLPFLCLPQMLDDLQVKLSTGAFVSISYLYTHVSLSVMTFFRKFSSAFG